MTHSLARLSMHFTLCHNVVRTSAYRAGNATKPTRGKSWLGLPAWVVRQTQDTLPASAEAACLHKLLIAIAPGWVVQPLALMLLSLACKISCHPIITHCSLQPTWQACHGCSCGAFNNQSDTTPCAAVQQRRHSVRKNARHSCVCERHSWVSRFRWLRQRNKQLTAALLRPRCKFTMHTPSCTDTMVRKTRDIRT